MIVLGAFQAHPLPFESITNSMDLRCGADQVADGFEAALLVVGDGDPVTSMVDQVGDKPFVVLAEESRMLEMVELGCSGFVTWNTTPDELVDAMKTVLEGGAAIPPSMLGTLLRHIVRRRRASSEKPVGWDELTDRERQVYELASLGTERSEIARTLFISPDTVRTHLQRIYQKLGVHSQTELMSLSRTELVMEEVDE